MSVDGADKLIQQLIAQLDSAQAVVRQDAATALGDLGHQATEAVNVLRERLVSAHLSYHDRSCAAWALSQICEKGNREVVSELLHVLHTETSTPDADNLRRYCGFAIEELASDNMTLEFVRMSRKTDPYWIRASKIVAQIPSDLD